MVWGLPITNLTVFQGHYVFTQVMSFLSQHVFTQCVEKFSGDRRVKTLTCWQQFLAMAFGQLGKRESLRDVCLCFEAHQNKLYHLGFSGSLCRATLQDANEHRDYRIYESFAYILIGRARLLYVDDTAFTLELSNVVYALDSTTIGLCLSLFSWAPFRSTKAGIKLHTLVDLRGNIPTFIHITEAMVHDVKVMDVLVFEAGAFYVMDRGYLDFARLYRMHQAGSFFVTRAKDNTKSRRLYSQSVSDEEKKLGIRCDQIILFSSKKGKKAYPEKLRRVSYYDAEQKNYYVFLTNNFTVSAMTIAELYRYRWQVELFFRWIKQHLKIQCFWGRSENAVKTQIWIAVATYVLVAIIKKQLKLSQSMNEILQILSISLFDKMALSELLQGVPTKTVSSDAKKPLQQAIF